jgi:OPA family glycerol-3-phosphate transporter-like MFS transporter
MGDAVLQYAAGYRQRRFLNWFFMGLAYGFLYWGRYNLTVAKTSLGSLMTNADFGFIFGAGTIVYAFSFLVNGPLTDKYGGRITMLFALAGSAIMNALMGLALTLVMISGVIPKENMTAVFAALYMVNMYFQSIGAVAIVKVNAPWFHVSERGWLGGRFGAMISMGLFFAFDVSSRLMEYLKGTGPGGMDANWWVFFAPAIGLAVMWVVEYILLQDRPSGAGFPDIDTGVPEMAKDEKPLPLLQLFKSVFSNPILITVAMIGICTGALRDGMMHWVPIYFRTPVGPGPTSGLGLDMHHPINANWGLMLMCAGIIGPLFGGWARDKVFHSRNFPPATIFYGILILSVGAMYFALGHPYAMAALGFCMALSYIGSQGLLTATAAMDFGGKARATATGVIDGFVYIGTAFQSVCLGQITSHDWHWWPVFLMPFAIIGFILCLRVWHVRADKNGGVSKSGGAH